MDGKGAIDLAQNPVSHKRSKHILIKYHWIREQVGGNIIKLNHVPTAEMTADMMTKALPERQHHQHLLLLLFSYLPRLSGPALQLRYFTSW